MNTKDQANKRGITIGSIHNEAARVRAARAQDRELTLSEKKRFFEMMKRQASAHELRLKMSLQPNQIAGLMQQYGVVTGKDLNRAIATIDAQIDAARRANIGVSQELNVPAQPELDKRKREQRAINTETVKTINTNIPGARKAARSLRDRRIEKINAAVEQLPAIYKDFRVAPGREDEFLKRLSMGKRLVARMYNVPQVVILAEALRIDPKINLDLIGN
jgi:hypothetical protein